MMDPVAYVDHWGNVFCFYCGDDGTMTSVYPSLGSWDNLMRCTECDRLVIGVPLSPQGREWVAQRLSELEGHLDRLNRGIPVVEPRRSGLAQLTREEIQKDLLDLTIVTANTKVSE